MPKDLYGRLVAALRQHAELAAALRLLEWDQETFMPSGVLDGRAAQIGALSAVLHEQRTDPLFLDLVDELAARSSELDAQQAVDVRETKWRVDRTRRLDSAFVRERSELHAQARGMWIGARRDDDFTSFAPFLERVVTMERRVAQAIDTTRSAYDVLLEGYEPGASTATILPLLQEVRNGVRPLVERLSERRAARLSATSALRGTFPVDAQRTFNRTVAECLGFDFNKGRLDEAEHPFTTSIGDDVRLTTRYDTYDLGYALFSTLHETGHGLYEQGLDPAAWGTPRGMSCSLGIHESQSRLWENLVGRSEAFWQWLLPIAQQFFPVLRSTALDAVLRAVNAARPSLIRTEADEITYNLHIVVRFEIETALIEGSLEVGALPQIWREKMRQHLGIEPATDRDGVLQDVHWATGAIGYFPTYALGNIYAAQLMRTARTSLGTLDAALSAGEFGALLGWLRTHVHRYGQTYRGPALITAATAQTPTAAPLLEHLQHKVAFLESA
jgi:carboxypeptidase Taq